MTSPRIGIVGGGLAGLTAAALLARDGHQVDVYEATGNGGGRARTTERDGFRFNLGVHALYRAGAATRVLESLGIEPPGATNFGRHARLLHRGELIGVAGLATRGGANGAVGVTRLVARLATADAATLGDTTFADWADSQAHGFTRELLGAFARISTYVEGDDVQAADATVRQLRLAARSVRYLHGGWQPMVDALRDTAVIAGATLHLATPVRQVDHDERVRGLVLADGSEVEVDAVVLAGGGPRDAAELLSGSAQATVAGWSARAVPVRVASLDVALSHLPFPRHRWVLGVDEPLYLNIQSIYADDLAPTGGAALHVTRYLSPGEVGDDAIRARSEALLDQVQPGWRDYVDHVRFLPHLTAAHDTPSAANGGMARRPGPAVPDVDGLYVAGDWVGDEGLLADATLASAATAAARIGHRAIASRPVRV